MAATLKALLKADDNSVEDADVKYPCVVSTSGHHTKDMTLSRTQHDDVGDSPGDEGDSLSLNAYLHAPQPLISPQ